MSRDIIIQISGKQGSGKSTLLTALFNRINNETGKEALGFKFADILYEMHDAAMAVAARYDIPLLRDRYTGKIKEATFLQWIGTEWGRNTKSADVWVNATRSKVYEKIRNSEFRCVVAVNDDTRFENEFHAFDDSSFKVLKVRLEAPEDARRERCSQWREDTSHVSETGLDAYAADGRFDMYFKTDIMSTDQIVEKIYNAVFYG